MKLQRAEREAALTSRAGACPGARTTGTSPMMDVHQAGPLRHWMDDVMSPHPGSHMVARLGVTPRPPSNPAINHHDLSAVNSTVRWDRRRIPSRASG